MRRLLAVPAFTVLASAGLVGCANGPDDTNAGPKPVDQRVAIPAAPANGFQVVGPEIVIPAGADVMMCWVPEIALTEDHLIKNFEAFQGTSGHHLFGMQSIVPRKAGDVFECSEVDQMTTVRPLITANSANKEGTGNLLTPEFAVRLPADRQLVMQSHYVNVTTHDIVIRDVGNFEYLPDTEQRIEANYMVVNDDTLDIPVGGEHYTHTTTCTVPQGVHIASLMGHMHEWGKHISVEHTAAADTAPVNLYEVANWTAAFRDSAPINHYPVDAPLVFNQGDTLSVTCDWINDQDADLTFPHEMCVTIMVYYPSLPDGFIICD